MALDIYIHFTILPVISGARPYLDLGPCWTHIFPTFTALCHIFTNIALQNNLSVRNLSDELQPGGDRRVINFLTDILSRVFKKDDNGFWYFVLPASINALT